MFLGRAGTEARRLALQPELFCPVSGGLESGSEHTRPKSGCGQPSEPLPLLARLRTSCEEP